MFIGQYNCKIKNEKLIIPKKLRNNLVNNDQYLIITIGTNNCLSIFPKENYQPFLKKLIAFAETVEDKNFVNSFIDNFYFIKMNDQGVIKIPDKLIAYASLKEDCVVLGINDRIEIFDKQKWLDYQKMNDAKIQNLYKYL